MGAASTSRAGSARSGPCWRRCKTAGTWRSPPMCRRCRRSRDRASSCSAGSPGARSIRSRWPPAVASRSRTGTAPPSTCRSERSPSSSAIRCRCRPMLMKQSSKSAASRSSRDSRRSLPAPMRSSTRAVMPARAERLPAPAAAYRAVSGAATPLAPHLLDYRLKRGKEHAERMSERRGEPGAKRPSGPLIWIHGASVGELIAVLPLIERMGSRGFCVLATSGTVTSAALATKRLPPGALHQFIPLDLPPYVARFLDHWRPDPTLCVESDLWPTLIMSAADRNIPMILVNGRMSARSFERWRKFPRTIEALLGRFDLCLVRTPDDAERFGALGAPRIATTGNLKLDVPPLPVDPAKLAALTNATKGRIIVAAASTHPGEESAIIEAHCRLAATFPPLLTIIPPRHPQRGPAG